MSKVLPEDLLLRQTPQSPPDKEDRMRILGPQEEEDTPGTKTLLTPHPSPTSCALYTNQPDTENPNTLNGPNVQPPNPRNPTTRQAPNVLCTQIQIY